MSVGDRVRVGMGTIDISPEPVAVYNLITEVNGNVVFDNNGFATPKVMGGVKGGSIGVIIDKPLLVLKSSLKSFGDGAAAMGLDHVPMYPVMFEHYQKVAWVPQDHVHITHGQLT